MTIVRAQRWKDGKPVGPSQIIEPKPKTLIEKGADAVERGLKKVARVNVGCSDCRKQRGTIAEKATETLRKMVPRR